MMDAEKIIKRLLEDVDALSYGHKIGDLWADFAFKYGPGEATTLAVKALCSVMISGAKDKESAMMLADEVANLIKEIMADYDNIIGSAKRNNGE